MTIKKYQQIKLMIVAIIAIIFSQSIIYRNYLIPLTTLIISTLVLTLLRRQVKEVIADERDYIIAGKSASWAIQIYSWIAVVVMFVLYALRENNPLYQIIASTLAYSTCVLMFIYSFLFKFKSHQK